MRLVSKIICVAALAIIAAGCGSDDTTEHPRTNTEIRSDGDLRSELEYDTSVQVVTIDGHYCIVVENWKKIGYGAGGGIGLWCKEQSAP